MAVPKGIEPSRHDRQSCIIPVDHGTKLGAELRVERRKAKVYETSRAPSSLPLKTSYHNRTITCRMLLCKTGGLCRALTYRAPRSAAFTEREPYARQYNPKWRRVAESNGHPCGAPVFKTGRITINSALQNTHI